MNLKSLLILAGISICSSLYSQSPLADWKEIAIPRTVEIKQQIENSPAGWEVHDSLYDKVPARYKFSHEIQNVLVYDGHPRDLVSLEEDSEKVDKASKTSMYFYTLAPRSKDGSWLKCLYTETRLSLCLQLPAQAKEIRITMKQISRNLSNVLKVEYR